MTIKLTPEQEAENHKANEALQRITKLSAYTTIENLEHRTETFNHRKLDPTKPATADNVTYDTRSLGYWMRIAGSSAICVGMNEPPAAFKRGARVKISVELAPEDKRPAEPVETVAPVAPKPRVDHAAMIGGDAADKAAAFRGDADPRPGAHVADALAKASSGA
jgi:hypothetical protein